MNLTYGRLSATDDFLTSPLYCQFVNNAFCGQPPTPFFNLPDEISSYPIATWGARMRQRHGLTVTMPTRRVAGARVSSRKTNEDGHVWSSVGDGVHCIDPSGSLLGKIKVPFTVSNLTFGGRCRSRLFICASQALFAIYTNQRGAQRP